MSATKPQPLEPLHGSNLILLTIAVSFAVFMEVLDLTIVNVSVPHIAGSLAVSPQEGTWAISSYALASAIMQPLSGWLARRFGEVRTFVTALMLFVTFSIACGLATSMPMLVIFRLLQGAGSGPMVALSLSLLLNSYPAERKGMALAMWAMTVMVAPIFGPILGGWLTDNYSWPWIFFINVPVGILAGVVVTTIMRGREMPTLRQPVDYIGIMLLVLGVGCLQFMLDNGNDKDWFSSPLIVVLGVIALISLVFLVAWELTDRHPIIDLSLFKSRNFTIGVIALSLGMLAFFGISVVFPLWLQLTLDYTATWAGLATAPVGILAFLLAPVIGRNIDRVDLRAIVSFSFIVFAGTSWWFTMFNNQTPFGTLIWPRLVMGLAIPCFFIPLNQMILSGLSGNQVASASGLANFFRTMASSVSTAVTVTLWQHRSEYHHAILAESVNHASPAATHYINTVQSSGVSQQTGWALIDRVVTQEALTLSVNDVFWGCAILFLALIPILWLARPPFGSSNPEAMH